MFDYIPDFYRPKEERHITYHGVYRAVINVETLTPEDFEPSFMEPNYRLKNKQSDYSVSLFRDKSIIILYRKKFPGFKKYCGIAVGDTSKERGVSIGGENSHVDYFLYDYLSNSPCEDFSVCEVFDE